jgi:hypothetical protein
LEGASQSGAVTADTVFSPRNECFADLFKQQIVHNLTLFWKMIEKKKSNNHNGAN